MSTFCNRTTNTAAGRAAVAPETMMPHTMMMPHALQTIWHEDDGVLSFEWVLLTTLVVIAVVGGLAAARDAITDELGDAAEAMQALDNSFTIAYPLLLAIDTDPTDGVPGGPVGLASDSSFLDVQVFLDCARVPQEMAP